MTKMMERTKMKLKGKRMHRETQMRKRQE